MISSMAEVWSTVILLILIQHYLINVGSNAQKSSNFSCHDGQNEINFIEVCDGELNCADGSDETGCDNDAILFYYIYARANPVLSPSCQSYNSPYYSDYDFEYRYHCNTPNYYGFRKLNATGIYLNEDKQFSILVVNETVRGRFLISWEDELPKLTNIQISFNGPRLDISYTSRSSKSDVNVLKRVTRAGFVENVPNTTDHIHRIKNMVIDTLTNNVYYISNSTIKVCDQNFVICVVALSSKFLRNPVQLTFSSKHRLLFWIEKISAQQHHLYKYAIDMGSRITLVSQDLKTPKLLTIDTKEDKIYWLEDRNGKDGIPLIYSITFRGTDLEAIRASENVTSFAVFDNTIYFRSNTTNREPQDIIWKCSADSCNEPTQFRRLNLSDVNGEKHRFDFEIGSLTIYHRPPPTNETRNECTNSWCSHLCLVDSETFFKCYCEGSDKPLSASSNNGFCEDTTMIAVHENHLYVVGLFSNWTFTQIFNKPSIKINDSISTVTYDSLKGRVILTGTNQQKIYSWTPRTGDLMLLSDDGGGSIMSIEFDDYANNLYWVDPVNFSIKVMNLDTRIKVIILEGNSTYLPIELTLCPAKGYMFVQFLKNNSTIVVEHVSMDGRELRHPIHVDREIEDRGNLHLHYMTEADTLYLLDRQRNKIGYFLNEKSGFQDLTHSNSVGKIQSVTSINNSIIWWEDDFVIRKGNVNTSQLAITQTLSLKDLAKNGKDVLKVVPVVKSTVEPRLPKCLRNNGGCQELCLVTEKSPKFVCVCTGSKILVNGSACEIPSEIVVLKFTTNENTAIVVSDNSSKIDHNEGNASKKRIENVVITKEQIFPTESSCIKSCPILECPILRCPILECPILQCPLCEQIKTNDESPSKWNSSVNTHKNDTNYVESCPVCQSSGERLSIYHLLNLIFIAMLAIPLGFTLGYLFHRCSSRYGNSKFLHKSGTVEMLQVTTESASTALRSKSGESVKNARNC